MHLTRQGICRCFTVELFEDTAAEEDMRVSAQRGLDGRPEVQDMLEATHAWGYPEGSCRSAEVSCC